MSQNHEIDPALKKKLAALQQVPARDAGRARQGRAAYLQEAENLAGEAVTQPEIRRHTGWMEKIQTFFLTRRKERYPMINILATLVVVVTLMVGGGSATLAAAQSSQPGDSLYQMKLFSENAQFNITVDEQTRAQLALTFASRRAEEVQTMLQAGQMPPEDVQARYQEQVEQAIAAAAGLSDDQAAAALNQIRIEMRAQEETMARLQTGAGPELEAACTRIQTMLEEHRGWLDQNLEQLRRQLEQMKQKGQHPMMTGTPGFEATPTPTDGMIPPPTPVVPTMPPTPGPWPTREIPPTPVLPTPQPTWVMPTMPPTPEPWPTREPQPTPPGPMPTLQWTPMPTCEITPMPTLPPMPTFEWTPMPTPQGPGPQGTPTPGGQGKNP